MEWIIPDQKEIPLLQYLYLTRDIKDLDKFHNPKLSDLTDPFKFYDMSKAVKTINKAIKGKKKIYIHGDFDADGITATSILWSFLYRELHADVMPYIPSRFDEGYGLTKESIETLINKGAQLIITVDCGVKDIELINEYSSKVDFLITDHHTIRKDDEKDVEGSKVVDKYLISSKAKAVIHPLLSSLEFKQLCGASVALKVVDALIKDNSLEIDISKYLELATIGTVCDVMPLIEENRTIVSLGLKELSNTKNIGLKELFKLAGIKGKLNTYHIGYIIGPRLNASGRMGDALEGVKLLTTNSLSLAHTTARNLEILNLKRREITEVSILEAEKMLDLNSDVIFLTSDKWSEGIVGLIAGKLAEKYFKPVIIGSKNLENKEIKASVRNPLNFNIVELLDTLKVYIKRYGGHSQAAGLTLELHLEEDFIKNLGLEVKKFLNDKSAFVKQILVDGVVNDFKDIDINFVDELNLMEPFGMGNKRPLLYSSNINFKTIRSLGSNGNHVKGILYDSLGNEIEFLGFNKSEMFLNLDTTLKYEILYTLDIDDYRDKKVVIKLENLR